MPSCRRATCGALVATISVPVCCQPQSIASAATTSPISRHGVGHRALAAAHGVVAAQALVAARAAREARGGPAAVAAGRPEAGDLALDDDDAQVGLQQREEVGGPQPGEAGADDRDVAVAVARQRRPRRERLREAVEPEAARAVAGLQRRSSGDRRQALALVDARALAPSASARRRAWRTCPGSSGRAWPRGRSR